MLSAMRHFKLVPFEDVSQPTGRLKAILDRFRQTCTMAIELRCPHGAEARLQSRSWASVVWYDVACTDIVAVKWPMASGFSDGQWHLWRAGEAHGRAVFWRARTRGREALEGLVWAKRRRSLGTRHVPSKSGHPTRASWTPCSRWAFIGRILLTHGLVPGSEPMRLEPAFSLPFSCSLNDDEKPLLPGTQMAFVLIGKHFLEGWSPKIEDKQVSGVYRGWKTTQWFWYNF